jgi:chitin disaccharide deacetylase
MKSLIVNGDDFGAGRGVNRGIAEAHRRGILTSTSLMVDLPFSLEAARLSRDLPHLSVGLHVHVPADDPDRSAAELRRQLDRFQELMGCLPTHLDSHHDAHRHPRLLPHFLALAGQHGLPLRGHSPVRCFSQFYGQWGGESHPEHVSVPSLERMLRAEVVEGYSELICHPGHADPDLHSSYSGEREAELSTLCDARVRATLSELQIRLIGFRDLPGLLRGAPA